jgi:hypothetical protein
MPFRNTGVDLAGPFMIKNKGHNNKQKVLIVILTCLACRAAHLELAGFLSAEDFQRSFTSFCARCGTPETMISDNAMNFVNTALNISKQDKQLLSNSFTERSTSSFNPGQMICWKFNPPAAPHFGGIYESIVKIMKSILRKHLHKKTLNRDDFEDLLRKIEITMNDRPLVPAIEDPKDQTWLTPSHFVIGRPVREVGPKTKIRGEWNLN